MNREMQLRIRKRQADKKGLFGGHKGVEFEINAKANISSADQSLIDRYILGPSILYSWEVGTGEDSRVRSVTVSQLVNGVTYSGTSLPEIQQLEAGIIEGAKNLKTYLNVASSFDGETIIEI